MHWWLDDRQIVFGAQQSFFLGAVALPIAKAERRREQRQERKCRPQCRPEAPLRQERLHRPDHRVCRPLVVGWISTAGTYYYKGLAPFATPLSFPDTATQAGFVYRDRIDGSNPAKMLFGNILAVKMSLVRYIVKRPLVSIASRCPSSG
jgi:hypothetical protein